MQLSENTFSAFKLPVGNFFQNVKIVFVSRPNHLPVPRGARQHGQRDQELDRAVGLPHRQRPDGPGHRGRPLLHRPRPRRDRENRGRQKDSSGEITGPSQVEQKLMDIDIYNKGIKLPYCQSARA